jgi:tetratricopeptide (TPR) repeat protein
MYAKLFQQGNAYRTMGRFNNALKSFSDVLSYCKLFIRDPNIDAIAIGNIGSTYRHMGRHEEALKQAFIYLDMVENQAGRAGNREDDVRNIAQGHSSIGTAMRLTGRYQESLDEQLNALAMILPFETEHKDFIPTIYGKIGHSYSALGDRDKANENYKLAIDKAIATGSALTVAVAYCNWFYFLLLPHETNISAVDSPPCGESESDIESAANYNQSCNIFTADERTALVNCVQTLEEYKSPFEASARNSLGRFYFLMSFNSSTKPSGDAIDYQEESYRMHQAAYSLALKFNLPLQEGFARLGLANNHLFWAERKGLDKKSNNEALVSHGKGSLLANQHSDHIRAAVAIMDNHVEGTPAKPTFTAAMAAATVGWMSDLQRTFKSGIDMTQYDSSGYTFYDYACMHNHQSEVLALMQANLPDVAVIEVLTSETSLKSILRTLVLEKFSGTKVSKEIRSIFALTMEQSINGEAIKTNAVEEESNATTVEVPSDKMRDCHKVFDHVRYVPFQTLESLGHIPHSGENVAVMSSEDERKDDMKCVFISHRWLRPHWCPGCLSKECGMEGYPDEADNRKWKMIIIAIHRTIEKFEWDPACVRVWIDYSCLDQNNFDRLMAGVHSLPIYVLASDVVISLPDENYFNRAWCLMEVMYARLSREGRKFPQRFDFLKDEEADDFILRPDDGKSELKNPREGQFTSEKDRRSIRFLELVARLVM